MGYSRQLLEKAKIEGKSKKDYFEYSGSEIRQIHETVKKSGKVFEEIKFYNYELGIQGIEYIRKKI